MARIAGQVSDHSFVLPRLRQSFSHAMFLFRFYVFGEWTLNKNAVIIKIIRCVARPPQSAFNVLHGPLGVLWNTSVFFTRHGTREQSFVCAVSAAAILLASHVRFQDIMTHVFCILHIAGLTTHVNPRGQSRCSVSLVARCQGSATIRMNA